MDFLNISKLADQGMLFVGTYAGMSQPLFKGWSSGLATSDNKKIKSWLDQGYNLCVVAHHGNSLIVEIDDYAAAKAMGMPPPTSGPSVRVWSASDKGKHNKFHLHARSDAATDALGDYIYVEDANDTKIVELKLNGANAVAAPGAYRKADDKKCEGTYDLDGDNLLLDEGLTSQFIAWILKHGHQRKSHEKYTGNGKGIPRFHPDFDREAHLESFGMTEGRSWPEGGALWVATEQCAYKGDFHGESVMEQVRDKKTCVIYGPNGVGFSCPCCGIYDMDEVIEELEERGEYEEYDGYIYEDDDPEYLLNSAGFEVEDVGANEFAPKDTDSIPAPQPEAPISYGEFSTSTPVPTIPPPATRISKEEMKIHGVIHLTETGNAKRLVQKYGNDLRFNFTSGKWYVWDGTRFQIDLHGIRTIKRAKVIAQELAQESEDCDDEELQKALKSHARRSENYSTLVNTLNSAESEGNVAVPQRAFDANDWLLNLRNCSINLRTGEAKTNDRADLCTKHLNINYDPCADCPTWKQFINEVLGGNQRIIEFVQEYIGYTLTALTSDQSFVVCYGPKGSNGKSTLLHTMQKLMGEYGCTADPDMIVVTKNEKSIPNDIARLDGMRAVFLSETEQTHRLNEAKMKKMTGEETMTGRFLHGEYFDFDPKMKMWLTTNHLPKIIGTDDAIWRRPICINFDQVFKGDNCDPHLRAKLELELSGILNWALMGEARWVRRGCKFDRPEEVNANIKKYRHEQDTLQHFIDECCVVGNNKDVQSSRFTTALRKWADDNGEFAMGAKEIKSRMESKGFGLKPRATGNYWLGIALSNKNDPMSLDEHNLSTQPIPDIRDVM